MAGALRGHDSTEMARTRRRGRNFPRWSQMRTGGQSDSLDSLHLRASTRSPVVRDFRSMNEVREHAIGGGFYTGILLGEGEAGENVGFEPDYGRRSANQAERIRERHLLRFHVSMDLVSMPLGPANELVRLAIGSCAADLVAVESSNTLPLHLLWPEGDVEDDINQGS